MIQKKIAGFFVVALLLGAGQAGAQAPRDTLVGLAGALQLAEHNYPLLKARRLEADASAQNVAVAKYSRMPTIDASYQANLSTANNLTGQFYPYGILPMTGPPSTGNNYSPATGSAAAVLLNWQAVTFGQRNAQIEVSVREAKASASGWQQELFNQKINVISVYLDVLLALDKAAIQEHNIARVQESLRQSRELAGSGIRPGVDTALFLSELSKARIEGLNARKQLKTEQWLLAQLIVTDALPVPVDTAFLERLPVGTTGAPVGAIGSASSLANHPLVVLALGEFAVSQSKEQLLKKSFLPKLSVWGTAFARGSGFGTDGTVKTWDGMGLSRYNYGAGLQLSFPIMKYGEVRRQLKAQGLLSRAAAERLQDTRNALATQERITNAAFTSSLAVAAESRQQLKSGEYAYQAMQIRYNTGLVSFSDLIQTQYNLLKAELDLRTAYWDAWKGLLLQAAVKGDENIFLQEIAK
jgi:outer membrane protein